MESEAVSNQWWVEAFQERDSGLFPLSLQTNHVLKLLSLGLLFASNPGRGGY